MIFTVFNKTGILFVYLVAPEVEITTMSYISISFVAFFMLTFIWMPETPQYLLSKGKHLEAHRSLRILRRNSESITNELNQMQLSINYSALSMFGSFKQLIRDKGSRNAMLLIMAIGGYIQLCGSQAIVCNSKMILEHFSSGALPSNVANVLLGCVQVVSAIFASFVVDYFGRRPLFLIGVVVTGLCNGIIAAYFWADRMEYDVGAFGWIPMLMVFVFIIFYTIGLISVYGVLVGELFAKDVRSIAAGISMMHMSLLAAIVTKLFQVSCDNLGRDSTFFMFVTCSVVAFQYLWSRMPETKGKRLDDIQKEFNS